MRRWRGAAPWLRRPADQQGRAGLDGTAHQRRRTSNNSTNPRHPTTPPMGLFGPISQAGAEGLIVTSP
jgi:hypothetical protein